MRQALLGMAGVMLAPDYLGKTVIAGYQPLPSLNAGLVAKIDIEEIRAPFLKVFYSGLIIVFIFSTARKGWFPCVGMVQMKRSILM